MKRLTMLCLTIRLVLWSVPWLCFLPLQGLAADVGEDGTAPTIPTQVDVDSLKISGSWSNFNISWSPSRVQIATQIYYTVTVEYAGQAKPITNVSIIMDCPLVYLSQKLGYKY